MKNIWKYSLLLAGVLAAAVAVNQLSDQSGQGIFYRVSGGKNTMYLLGSIHVGSKEMYPMPAAIRTALDNADVMVFECDTTSAEARMTTAQMMKSDVPLSAVISKSCYERLEQAAEKLGYSMDSFEYLKPWAVTSTLTVAAAAQEMDAGNSRTAAALGVENMVRKQADKHEIAYLETAAEQLGLMEAFSPELQDYLLSSACSAVLEPGQSSGMDEDVDLWPEWWREGNAQAFADSYLRSMLKEISPELAQEYHQSLVVARNRQMVQKLQAMLEGEEVRSYVVTVGLMHLVLPEDSIITMLSDMGYCVEQIVQ